MKGWVTRLCDDARQSKADGVLTKDSLRSSENSLNAAIGKLEDNEFKIDDVYQKYEITDGNRDDVPSREPEAKLTFDFIKDARGVIAGLYVDLENAAPVLPPGGAASLDDVLAAVSNKAVSKVNLDCKVFDSDKASKFEFRDWYEQFKAVMSSWPKCEAKLKLAYLKSKVEGTAKLYIVNLEQSNDNYQIALKILEGKYLDKEFIKDELFKELLNAKPEFHVEYEKTKVYIQKTMNNLEDLKRNYSCDLITAPSGGNAFISHIIFSKLSPELQKALIIDTKKTYPTLKEINDNYERIIKMIVKTKQPYKNDTDKQGTRNLNYQTKNAANFATPVVSNPNNSLNGAASNSVYKPNNDFVRHCRFCNTSGHVSTHCYKHSTYKDRLTACADNNLCTRCTSHKHVASDCLGAKGTLSKSCKFCQKNDHAACMCPSKAPSKPRSSNSYVCLSSNEDGPSQFLLPVFEIAMEGHNGNIVKFNALLDTASHRSYVNKDIKSKLKLNVVKKVQYDVRTFIGNGAKNLEETSVKVFLPSGRHHVMPILIDDEFDINLNVINFEAAHNNFKSNKFKLAANFEENSNSIHLQGLIGCDILQFVRELKVVECMNGPAYQLASGLVPFGNIDQFLYPHQICKYAGKAIHNYKTIISSVKECRETITNFVVNPKRTYNDPFESFFDESLVERRIDHMLSIESLGINEDPDHVSNYDQMKIDEFKNGIEIRNKQVFVNLVWHDNVNLLPSNHVICLSILRSVYGKLDRTNRVDEYNNIFLDYEKENIIEKFECKPEQFHNYVWIPHHPVIKDDEVATTKLRPVFNCSLKTANKPSINETSYAGVNLMADMCNLLILFRTNKYTLLGDLRKAFLMIKLKSEKDKNRFCFFVKLGDKLVCYRYTTIIFGYNSSPFILNYVIKYLADLYPNDDVCDIMKNKFFVDNLVTTSDDVQKLTNVYKESISRFDQAGFDLRSCNTNNNDLRNLMKQDNKYIEHDNRYDKVLGYRYDSDKDIIKLSKVKLNPQAKSKRAVLSQTSKIFDPLSFCAPVTVRGKTLVSGLWAQAKGEDHWDEEISVEAQKNWSDLSQDLNNLEQLTFPRYTVTDTEPFDLILFCDASTRAYGFVCYSLQNGATSFVFSKCKVAPIKHKTLPTLELLSVFVAYKALENLLYTFKNCVVKSVTFAVDAQVVLSWLLDDNLKTKNLFALNRVKDINKLKSELSVKYKVSINYRFVPTLQNPADMLTRGLSFDKFEQNFDTWCYGPQWLRSINVNWPTSELNCVKPCHRSIVLNINLQDKGTDLEPLVPFEKYSSLSKLINVTTFVIKALRRFKALKNEVMTKLWNTDDDKEAAKIHLLSVMQHQSFQKELKYLKQPQGNPIPDLVNNLNLFVDPGGILRSDGRIGKTHHFGNEIINPAMLGKLHPLTKLIVEDSHRKVRHLGLQATLNQVRLSGFWITKPFQTLKSLLKNCVNCQKFNALSFRYPKVTNLPKHRVNLIKPFIHTGVDYTGHIFVKEGNIERKYYILIFTCLNIRACHIELLPDMSTEQFILAFNRFINEYGVPTHVYSDNGKSFIAGMSLVRDSFNSDRFRSLFDNHNIKHLTIPLYSPWQGSCWERLIRTIKGCLRKTLRRIKPTYFKLITILSDIQLAVNSRPLTYRCAENSGLDIITPNCFLKPNANFSQLLKPDSKPSQPPSRAEVIKSLDERDAILQDFVSIWYTTYLLSLRSLHKDLHQYNFSNKIKINDIVLIKNFDPRYIKSRQHWKLGRVKELIPGDDGRIRQVKVLKGRDWNKEPPKIEVHSISHLYPLELSLTHDHVVANNENPAELVTEPIPIVEEDLELEEEVDESFQENDFAFNEQDKLNHINDEHHVSQGLVPELKDIVSDNPLTDLDGIDPNHKEVNAIPLHPSGRPVRKVTGRGRPLDEQYVYEI